MPPASRAVRSAADWRHNVRRGIVGVGSVVRSWVRCLRRDYDFRLFALGHHFVAALMLALSVLVLEEHRTLEWLDAVMLRLASQPLQEGGDHAKDRAAGKRPSIVVIDRDAYRESFGQRSPLDRATLVRVIDAMDLTRTRVLAIDLDIGPIPDEALASRAIDRRLASLVAGGKVVVLALPEPSAHDVNLPWIRARCADGIRFASPLISERLGTVTRRAADTVPSLANVAFQSLSSHAPAAERICAVANETSSESELHRAAARSGHEEHGGEEVASPPLDPNATSFRYLARTRVSLVSNHGVLSLDQDEPLAEVVMLGGDFDPLDRFRVAGGELSGLEIHAAIFASLQSNNADVSPVRVLAFDVVLGVLLGFFFRALWMGFEALEHCVLNDRKHWFPLRFFGLRVANLCVWLVPVLLAWGLFLTAQQLLHQGLWLNPGPIIAGMFLHALSLRKQPESGHHAGHSFRQFCDAHPDTVWIQVPIVVGLALWLCLH